MDHDLVCSIQTDEAYVCDAIKSKRFEAVCFEGAYVGFYLNALKVGLQVSGQAVVYLNILIEKKNFFLC